MSVALIVAALVAGFAGSGHCIGMCGPIVAMFESTPGGELSALRRRVGYHVGRLGFYIVLGAAAGLFATALAASMPARAAAMTLRAAAALALLLIGVRLLVGRGSIGALDRAGQALWRRISPLARLVLPMNSLPKSVAAGFIWGAVPCGLVYSMLAVAAVSGSAANGALVMAAFWLGTLPSLGALGAGASGALGTRYRKLTGAAMIAFAVVSIGLLWQPHGMPDAAAGHQQGTPAAEHMEHH